MMRIFQKGFNFSQDGPGNRLVYHLAGCNMRCIWCANPEGFSGEAGEEYTVETLLSECIRSRKLFFSGGGVTFTGGEATLQFDELLSLLTLLKKEGIHTCLETNGSSEKLPDLLPFIDYLIMDIKHYDHAVHKAYTGLGNEMTLQNFAKNCNSGQRQHIRIPLILEFNGENPEAFADFFAKYDTKNTCFEFLPYHEYGKEKWTTPYLIKDGFMPKEAVEAFKEAFKSRGLSVITT